MYLCEDKHETICYEGHGCPLCAAVDEIDELSEKIEAAMEEIEDLSAQLDEAR